MSPAVPEAPAALPPRLAIVLERTLDLQMWCWGRAIRRSEGNILVALGCSRHVSARTGRSEYRGMCDAGVVRLWGFGVVLAPAGGTALALCRNSRQPRLLDAGDGAREEVDRDGLSRAGRGAGPGDRRLLARLLPPLAEGIADYEMQVRDVCGRRWRERVQAGWARWDGSAIDLSRRWRHLARVADRALTA